MIYLARISIDVAENDFAYCSNSSKQMIERPQKNYLPRPKKKVDQKAISHSFSKSSTIHGNNIV